MSKLFVNQVHNKTDDNPSIIFKDNKTYLTSKVKPNPGNVVNEVVRMVRKDFVYSTGGEQYEYFAEISALKTKITARCKYSAFYVTMWINGEFNNTHDWSWGPIRKIGNGDFTNMGYQSDSLYNDNSEIYDWYYDKFNANRDDDSPTNREWQFYNYWYTNPNGWEAGYSNYDSTPISTVSIHFIDVPGVEPGTDIWYSSVLQSTGNHTFYLNRCVNSAQSGAYERGVSGVRIQEISGKCVVNQIQTGIEEYHFGDYHVTQDTTGSNSSAIGISSEVPILYESASEAAASGAGGGGSEAPTTGGGSSEGSDPGTGGESGY